MPPSIDDDAPLDPYQSQEAVNNRDGSTTVAITAEEAAFWAPYDRWESNSFNRELLANCLLKGWCKIHFLSSFQFSFVSLHFDYLHFDFIDTNPRQHYFRKKSIVKRIRSLVN